MNIIESSHLKMSNDRFVKATRDEKPEAVSPTEKRQKDGWIFGFVPQEIQGTHDVGLT